MATAKKLPSGNWRIQKYIGKDERGKRVYKYFTARTKKEAEHMAAEYRIDFERNQRLRQEMAKNPADYLTVHEAMAAYIELKSNILSPSTLYGYQVVMDNRFLDIQNMKLSSLTNSIIQCSINKDAVNVSPKTLANASGFLSAVLGQYYPDFHYKVTLPAKKKKIKELPEPASILSVVKGTNVELPVLLAMWLSYRMSEVRGIRKQDITKDGYIVLNQTKLFIANEEIIRDNAKTAGSIRKLKVPDYIMKLINQLPDEQEYLVPEKPQTITKRFYRLLAENNLPHITFHDLRHLNASVMVMLGIQEKYAMERGGWSTPHVLQSVYQHTFSSEREAVDKKIDDYFCALIE